MEKPKKERAPRKPKNTRVIKFRYAGHDQVIRWDGQQFIPQLRNEGNQEGFVDGGYFSQLGSAVKKIINHEISEEQPNSISLMSFVKRYEDAVGEILNIQEDDMEF